MFQSWRAPQRQEAPIQPPSWGRHGVPRQGSLRLLQETWPASRGNRELSDHLRPTRTGTMRATRKEMLRICGPNRKPEWKEGWAPGPSGSRPESNRPGFPGGPGAETRPSQSRGRGSAPGQDNPIATCYGCQDKSDRPGRGPGAQGRGDQGLPTFQDLPGGGGSGRGRRSV